MKFLFYRACEERATAFFAKSVVSGTRFQGAFRRRSEGWRRRETFAIPSRGKPTRFGGDLPGGKTQVSSVLPRVSRTRDRRELPQDARSRNFGRFYDKLSHNDSEQRDEIVRFTISSVTNHSVRLTKFYQVSTIRLIGSVIPCAR